jgi:hypothetical protein
MDVERAATIVTFGDAGELEVSIRDSYKAIGNDEHRTVAARTARDRPARPLASTWSVVSFSTSQPRGLFLILLPDVAEPLGLGALSGVENRPDDGRTSVGMKRD